MYWHFGKLRSKSLKAICDKSLVELKGAYLIVI